ITRHVSLTVGCRLVADRRASRRRQARRRLDCGRTGRAVQVAFMKQLDSPVLDSPLMDSFAPATLTPAGGESSSVVQDWDWHAARRVAALRGFDTEARQARRRGLRSRSETPWQPSAALTGSQRAKWSSQEAGIVDHLSQGNWYQLVTALEDAMKAR